LIEERVRHGNRIKGLLFAQGIFDYAPIRRDRRARLEALRTGDGRELPSHLKAQIGRELDRIELLLGQIKAVEAAQEALLAAAKKPASQQAVPDPVTMLLALKGLGANFVAVLWSEAFYRQFANRRKIAAYSGLAATPWQSGGIRHEQGVSKAGNPRLRTTMIQLAWLWIRHQPQSALTRWFKERSPQGRKRAIVALARKLLVALWKYVTQGVEIEGAVMKPAAISPGRSGWTNRWIAWLQTPQRRMASSSRACPPQAESWCSRLARRPNVSLIWQATQVAEPARTLDR
jgi:transposase